MLHYVGLDVSVKSVSICVVDEDGEVLARGETSSDPDEIASFIFEHSAKPERVVHESGILAIWLTRELEKRGLPIICIDARLAHKALSGRINKSDTGDAEGLAHLARTGWFSRVHIRSEASERVRVLIGARERLIRMRKDLEAHVRGVLKVFGVCMGSVGRANLRQGFRDQLAGAGQTDPALGVMADMFIPIHRTLCAAAEAMDEDLRLIARESGLARRLMTVPGLGLSSRCPLSLPSTMRSVSGDRGTSAPFSASRRGGTNPETWTGPAGYQNAEIVICEDCSTPRPPP